MSAPRRAQGRMSHPSCLGRAAGCSSRARAARPRPTPRPCGERVVWSFPPPLFRVTVELVLSHGLPPCAQKLADLSSFFPKDRQKLQHPVALPPRRDPRDAKRRDDRPEMTADRNGDARRVGDVLLEADRVARTPSLRELGSDARGALLAPATRHEPQHL